MPSQKQPEQPRIVEVSVNFNGGGKVAIVDFGKLSSDYGASISRRYAIPESMSEEDIAIFEVEKVLELKEQLEPILQAEFDERYERREWENERGPLAGT
jgi:hypothetical protein